MMRRESALGRRGETAICIGRMRLSGLLGLSDSCREVFPGVESDKYPRLGHPLPLLLSNLRVCLTIGSNVDEIGG